MTNAYSKW